MRRLPRALAGVAAFVLGAGAALGAGCGGSDEGLIPSGQAGTLTQQADAVREAVDRRDCDAATAAAERFAASVAGLADAGVDARLRTRLRSGATRLTRQAGEQCNDPAATTSTPSTSTPTVPTPTETTPTASTSTVPAPTTSAANPPPEPPATTPAQPDTGAASTPTPPADDGSGGATGDGTAAP